MKLNNKDVIIFPTDTVYGIGARIKDTLALEKIYEIKKRPKDKRLAVLCSSLEDIESSINQMYGSPKKEYYFYIHRFKEYNNEMANFIESKSKEVA